MQHAYRRICSIARTTTLAGMACLGVPLASAALPAPDATAQVDCLFNWMEARYPALLTPAGGASSVRDGYYYRDYGNSGTRLAAGNGQLWLLGQAAIDLSNAGTVNQWLVLSGCGQADTTPPAVLYTSRSDGAQAVALNAPVVVALSEPIAVPGALDATLTLQRDDGQQVKGKVSYDSTTATLILQPDNDLEKGRSYTATLSADLRDLAGNALGAPYRWQFTTDSGGKRNTDVQNQLQYVLDRAIWRNDIPGATIAVLDTDGQLWSTASGYADLTNRTPMTDDRLLRIGSNTKTFVGTAILQQVDAGRIRLDAPINTYLAEELHNYLPFYDGNRITVRQLLNHTSGIVNFTTDKEWGDAFISDPFKRYFPQELLMIANRNVTPATVTPPGSFSYSNTNYVLLGLLLGKVGPLVYEDAIRLSVMQPLALHNTLVPLIGDAVPPPRTSRGYWEDTETAVLHDLTIKDPSTVWSSGDMIADIADLARWGMALGQGALLSGAAQTERLSFVTMSDTLEYGLGIVRDRQANLLGHQGGIIGYTSQTYYVPEEQAAVAFFYNRTLAMPDYSAVMTYDALRLLWPQRYGRLVTHPVQAATGTPQHRQRATRQGIPGLLNEY